MESTSKTEGIDPELLRRFYEGYLNLLHVRAIQSRAEGAFERANLFEEVAHQWECMNIITDFAEFRGLLSLYVDELAKMHPRDP
jgi:hypothetical protein